MPAIKSWQAAQVDKMLAHAASHPDAQAEIYTQAAILGINDPIATESLANYHWQRGEYQRSLQTYQTSWLDISELYLGNTALKSHIPGEAKKFYHLADKQTETAESQAGLATVAFIEGRIDQGCNHADRAKKLNLSSQASSQAVENCAILQGTSKTAQRNQAHSLINSFIFEVGSQKLESISDKTVSDWQTLASVYSSRGEYKKALQAAEQGLKLNPANYQLLQTMVDLCDALGEPTKKQHYQELIEELQFKKF